MACWRPGWRRQSAPAGAGSFKRLLDCRMRWNPGNPLRSFTLGLCESFLIHSRPHPRKRMRRGDNSRQESADTYENYVGPSSTSMFQDVAGARPGPIPDLLCIAGPVFWPTEGSWCGVGRIAQNRDRLRCIRALMRGVDSGQPNR